VKKQDPQMERDQKSLRTALLERRFLSWGTCTSRGEFAYPKGYFKVNNRTEIYIYISFISKHLYIYQ